MKKLTVLILVLAIALTLCACGETASVEKEVEVPVIPDEYKDLIAAIESEDFDTAQKLLDAMKPVPETPPIKEVKITTENFFDYFEYVELPEFNRRIEKDSNGDIKVLMVNPAFVLRDEYKIAVESIDNSTVEAGVKYTNLAFYPVETAEIDINFSDLTYEITGKPTETTNLDSLLEARFEVFEDGTSAFYLPFNSNIQLIGDDEGTGFVTLIIDQSSIDLVSASGSLFLYE